MSRIREQTAKGRELYDSIVADYHKHLIPKHQYLDILMQRFDDLSQLTVSEIDNNRLELEAKFKEYEAMSTDFIGFLSRNRSVESEAELSSHNVVFNAIHDQYQMTLMNVDMQLAPIPEGFEFTPVVSAADNTINTHEMSTRDTVENPPSRSQYGSCVSRRSSRASRNSSMKSLYLKQKAEMEAARVRLQSAEKEAVLLRQQATLQVELSILDAERDFAEAQAKHRVILDGLEDIRSNSQLFDDESKSETSLRTRSYVEDQNRRLQLSSELPQSLHTATTTSANVGHSDSVLNVVAGSSVIGSQLAALSTSSALVYSSAPIQTTPTSLAPVITTSVRTWTAPSYTLDTPVTTWTTAAYTRTPLTTFTAPANVWTAPANKWMTSTSTPIATSSILTSQPRIQVSHASDGLFTPRNVHFKQSSGATNTSNAGTGFVSQEAQRFAHSEHTPVLLSYGDRLTYQSNPQSGPNNTSYSVPPLQSNSAITSTHVVDNCMTAPTVPSVQNNFDLFTKYLLRKDVLLSRLVKFNDNPEYYSVWKSSFKTVVRDLDIKPDDELDLLMKWLGPGSLKQAISIRSAYPHDSTTGIARIWERLDDQFASPERIEAGLKAKVAAFPRLTPKDTKQLYELYDLASEVQARKSDPKYANLLAYYDSSTGVNQLVSKLPTYLQEKWSTEGIKYKRQNSVLFPPFGVFVNFLCDQAKARNDPGFKFSLPETNVKAASGTQKNKVSTCRTDIERSSSVSPLCPLHKKNHKLNKCRAFREKPIEERKQFLKDNVICFKCCETEKHVFRNCKNPVKCDVCQSSSHPSALHVDRTASLPVSSHGGESSSNPVISSNCIQICGNLQGTSKSCAKIILVNIYPTEKPEHALRGYAIVDDQSNQTLAKSQLFDYFGENTNFIDYTLSSCSGSVSVSGRIANGYTVESLDGCTKLDLPTLVECDDIPDSREEIPTSETAFHHPHLRDIADVLPPLDPQADILLLIGRDLPSAHHVQDQCIGPQNGPYAQKLSLGWVVIGEVCLGNVHLNPNVTTNKTFTLRNGRPSLLEPCPNCFEFQRDVPKDSFPIFCKTSQDDKPGLSVEDKEFTQIMETGIYKNYKGNWTAPLPFKPERPRLPDNKALALRRAKSLDSSLHKDPIKRAHMFEFMSKILTGGHAEIAPELPKDTERCFLPLFGIYHPKKPGKIRGVFDSSAKCSGISLNDVLMTGPDLVNSLLGILLRFRKHPIAITADVEQMFYCFKVIEEHQNYLRFFWYKDNDFSKPLVEYRMTAHVFGNSPSPAVATFGLRKAVEHSDPDVREFVTRDFYVDDALTSLPDSTSAISLMQRTQRDLQNNGNIRLHKISSNDKTVLEAFPANDLSGDIKDLDLQVDSAPLQRSLGVYWSLSKDVFTFRSDTDNKPYTKRGLLSVIHSIYDPIGFASPVVLRGKLLFRDLAVTTDWDEPLDEEKRQEWETWQNSLTQLNGCRIPRQYFNNKDGIAGAQVRIYSDASKEAIAAVAYFCNADEEGQLHSSFILGKAKVAPNHGHTIPRLELCAAVLGTEVGQIISEQLGVDPTTIQYYTDSTVTLGYINNRLRRFYIYVGNRVDRILNVSKPSQWKHVVTDKNPADIGTRCVSASKLSDSLWLKGPPGPFDEPVNDSSEFDLVMPDEDSEVRPQITSLKTVSSITECLGAHRFSNFSTWTSLTRALASLINFAGHYSKHHVKKDCETVDVLQKSQMVIIKETQQEVYAKEIQKLKSSNVIHKDSAIVSLSPYLDADGVLRVGGRLNKSDFQQHEVNPVIIPGKHHVAKLLVRHYHQNVCHQGRHFTAGAIRSAGYWVTGSKRLISSELHKCVRCRRLRGKSEVQLMADLPTDRLTPSPPFTYVGVDIFGPWYVSFRRTRGAHSQQKRWAALFTCLVTRAVHIEVVEDMSSSCFINALRRFYSIRGPVKVLRSDRGSNFVGCTDSIGVTAINVEDDQMSNHLLTSGTVWHFNPPHSSHMGGSWERMIGTARRILDSMLIDVKGKGLTHEILTTLMAEVTAIINSRPLVDVSSDPEDPHVLSPSTLLTQKSPASPTFPFTLDIKDAYRNQWKMVQLLADTFWKKWRTDYIQGLQGRRKWTNPQPNLKEGDIVLLKDHDVHRMDWPMGIVTRVFPSEDKLVRKLELRVVKGDQSTVYVRPVKEVVLLISDN